MYPTSKVLKRACCIMLSMFLMLASAFAETTVTIENLCYGHTIDRMFVDEIPYTVSFMGHDWSFDEIFAYEDENHFGGVQARGLGERNSKVKHLPRMMGGKTLSVYEFTVYKDDFSAAPGDEELHLVTVEFDIPYETTIYAGVGNRKTGVYTFEEPIVVNGYYSEDIYMPRSETKLPAVVDRLYLYSYNTPSGPHYMALSLFINYDNLAEFYPAAKAVSAPSATPAPSDVPDSKLPSPDYTVLFMYLQNNLPISREMILRVVESGDDNFDGLRLVLQDHGVEFPFSDMEIIKYSLDLGLSVSEETIRRAVDSNEATMDELRELFASYDAEFPIQEEISYTISYQAMELYLSAGITPPADIVKQAKEENNLSDKYLTELFAAYGLEYKAAEPAPTPTPTPTPAPMPTPAPTPTPTPTPAPATETVYTDTDYDYALFMATVLFGGSLNKEFVLSVIESGAISEAEARLILEEYGYDLNTIFGDSAQEIPETVNTVRAKLETLEGFEYYADAGVWTYGIPYTKNYSNGKMQLALIAPGRGDNIDGSLAFTAAFTDHKSGLSLLDVQSIDVLAGDTVYSFPNVAGDEQLSAAAPLYGENGKLFTEALAAADAIDVRLNTENGSFTESIPAELYADTLKQTAAQLISLDVFSSWIIDTEIADRYPDDSITLREAPAKTVSSDFVSVSSFDGTWTLGVPYRSFYSNGTLRAALTLHGEGETVHGVPVFTAGFVNAEENELLIDVRSILVIADGKEFFFDAPDAAVNGYRNLLIGENGRAFIEALCNASEVVLCLNTEDGSAAETISGDELETTLKASAQAIMEAFYSK